MKDSKLPDSGDPPARVVAASSGIRSNTDGIETTNVAKPLPPDLPAVIVAMTRAERESTKIVKPLPRPTEPSPQRRIDRRWLLGAGIGTMALVAAIVVMNGGDEVPRRDELPGANADRPSEPTRARRIEIEPSEPPAQTAPASTEPRRVASDPAVEPTDPPASEPAPSAPSASEPPASSISSSRTSILRHRPDRSTEAKPASPRPSRATKPKRKPAREAAPKWNPDELFLKK